MSTKRSSSAKATMSSSGASSRGGCKPQRRRAGVDVVAAGEFGVKAGAEFQRRGDAPLDRDRAAGGLDDARQRA